ncbi:MAG: lactate utilization protein C [Chromatiales bacterium]|jgi:L-lactate dehydrogenase complex protein LldG
MTWLARTEWMMSNARQNILARLRDAPRPDISAIGKGAAESPAWDLEERVCRFTDRMAAVRAEVVETSPETWMQALQAICEQKGARNLLYSAASPFGEAISGEPPVAHPVTTDLERGRWKTTLFHEIDAALTTTLGGIAETGTLMLWPDKHEPRMMSLVPPLHIAILEAGKLFNTFAEAVTAMRWPDGMPTNALLISGPSKSADIEQTLAYGVHGPKELVVLLIRD